MRPSRAPLLLAIAVLLLPGLATAQDDDYAYDEPEQIELKGIASAGLAWSFQDTDLSGGDFDDGYGFEFTGGFTAGDYLAFLVSWEFARENSWTTHFAPVTVRGYSPSIADRVRFYGEGSIGLFFSRLRNDFDNTEDDNQRASAVRVRGGAEIEIVEDISALVYGGYLWGLGAADDYKTASAGLAVQFRWGL